MELDLEPLVTARTSAAGTSNTVATTVLVSSAFADAVTTIHAICVRVIVFSFVCEFALLLFIIGVRFMLMCTTITLFFLVVIAKKIRER